VQIGLGFLKMVCNITKLNLALELYKHFFWTMGCHVHPKAPSGFVTGTERYQTIPARCRLVPFFYEN